MALVILVETRKNIENRCISSDAKFHHLLLDGASYELTRASISTPTLHVFCANKEIASALRLLLSDWDFLIQRSYSL